MASKTVCTTAVVSVFRFVLAVTCYPAKRRTGRRRWGVCTLQASFPICWLDRNGGYARILAKMCCCRSGVECGDICQKAGSDLRCNVIASDHRHGFHPVLGGTILIQFSPVGQEACSYNCSGRRERHAVFRDKCCKPLPVRLVVRTTPGANLELSASP